MIRGHLIVPNSMVSEIGQLKLKHFYILLDLVVNRNIRTVFIVKLYVYTIVNRNIRTVFIVKLYVYTIVNRNMRTVFIVKFYVYTIVNRNIRTVFIVKFYVYTIVTITINFFCYSAILILCPKKI